MRKPLSLLDDSDRNGKVLAVAGRRIDAEDAEERRFPAGNETAVTARLRDVMVSANAQAVVCSAACGTDILTLEAAAHLGLPRRIVLPFSRRQFRATSVADRGGDWGRRFDAILEEMQAKDIIELHTQSGSKKAYVAANARILDEATAWAASSNRGALAVVVWNGSSRGTTDLTDDFRRLATERNLEVIYVPTL